MGNLFRLNSLFEYEITLFPQLIQASKRLLNISSSLEYLFMPLGNSSDYVLLSEKINEDLLEYWRKKQIQFSNPLSKEQLKNNLHLIEWGRTSIVQNQRLCYQKEIIETSKYLNSKINQCVLKNKLNINSLKAKIVRTPKDTLEFIKESQIPIVLKYEFGFSGGNKFLIKSLADCTNIENKIDWKQNKHLVAEEWIADRKTFDFSGIFHCARNSLELLCITEMLITKEGVYKGSIIKPQKHYPFREQFLAKTRSLFENLDVSYTGPLSIDGFWYKIQNKDLCQYISEINFRYSMGRILYQLYQNYGKECKEYSIILLSLRNKTLTINNIVVIFSNLEKNYNCRILLLTPVSNSQSELNQSIVIYIEVYGDYTTQQIVSVLKKI